MNNESRIKSFTDLNAWQQGHQLVLLIYQVTKHFPRSENYSLVDQMRRSAVSVTSNTAEGFSRRNKKEKIQFFTMALGSLTELQNQIMVARDVGYLEHLSIQELDEQAKTVHKLLNGLIRGTRAYYS